MKPQHRALFLAVCLCAGAAPAAAFAPPVGADGERLRGLWRDGIDLEQQGKLLAAVEVFETIVRLQPNDATPYWRIARSYWNFAATLSAAEEEERARYWRLVEEWADRGLAVDARCGECCLYKVAGMGGRLREEGKLAAARRAKDIAALLERGIEILSARPGHRTDPELEELYYAAAQFYRTMPESRWLGLLLGVRGSRRKAVEYMRAANAISTALGGERPDYLVELGAALLCVGREENEPSLVDEGNRTLARLAASNTLREKDPLSARDAGTLLEQPERACDYARDVGG